jgi:hypothetical protein
MSRYVTRSVIHIDRIATAWAILRFVDPAATFAFVRRERDPERVDGIAFDMRGAALSHHGGRTTFEVLLERERLATPGFVRMARIVHAIDLADELETSADIAGIRAVFDGIRDGLASDEQRLEAGLVVCDALYAYCTASARDTGSVASPT